MADAPDPAQPTRGERRGATVAVGIFVVLSGLFVVSSAWQLCRGVFFVYDPAPSATRAEPLDPNGTCAHELRTLADAIERGISASRLAPAATAAAAAFEGALRPEWDREEVVAENCGLEVGGLDAYGAVARLRRAGESFARHRASDLAKPHEDVAVALHLHAGGPPW
jgi:hypothetical protein